MIKTTKTVKTEKRKTEKMVRKKSREKVIIESFNKALEFFGKEGATSLSEKEISKKGGDENE